MSGEIVSDFISNNKISWLKVNARINVVSNPLGGGTSKIQSQFLE
jgi:hypothetical protein